jgi:hypothetical protein
MLHCTIMRTLITPTPRIAVLLPATRELAWHNALLALLHQRYGAVVEPVRRLPEEAAAHHPEQAYDIVLDATCEPLSPDEVSPDKASSDQSNNDNRKTEKTLPSSPLQGRWQLRLLTSAAGGRLETQLLMGYTPWLAVAEVAGSAIVRILADSCPAVPDRRSLATMQLTCTARLLQLVVRALDHLLCGATLPQRNMVPPVSAVPYPLARLRFSLSTFCSRLNGAAQKPFVHKGQWRLATRMGGVGSFQLWPAEPGRFLADPFLFRTATDTWLFCEEYCHIQGRGRIVWSRRDQETGGWTLPQPALEQSWHLSYPFVFKLYDQNIYMIPEQEETGRVTLYRALRFPDRWEAVCDLLSGEPLADPTLHRDHTGWWLFCGRGWDELMLYHATDFQGPYRPHPRNPIKSDVRSARPGGRLYRDDTGRLIRPAQDCSRGYGCALALCQVEELNMETYRETVVRHLTPRLLPGVCGVHSYDRLRDASGQIEVIDGKIAIQRREWQFGLVRDTLRQRRQQHVKIAV